MTDEHLLQLAREGDAACFGEVVRRWQRKIFGFIRRYVGDAETAEDLTQDTFTKAYRNLDRLADPGRFSSWVYKIALNECRMRYRKESRMVSLPWQPEQMPAEADTDRRTPETALAAREQRDALHRAFEFLPAEQREVILMKEYQGLKFHEIAEVLGLPLSTVKSRLYLGLKTLRRVLEERP